MAPPWTTTTKLVGSITGDRQPHPAAPINGFCAPPLLSDISFSPLDLFTSMARATVLKIASPRFLAAVQRSTAEITREAVDDLGTSFHVTSDLYSFADSERAGIAGRIGAGICDLYMVQRGYTWRDHARSIIRTTGPLADFVYEGGDAAGLGVVLAEAKGSFRTVVNRGHIKSIAENGYRRQVHNYIGNNTVAGRVLHGYAIGFGGVPGSNREPYLHVEETGIDEDRLDHDITEPSFVASSFSGAVSSQIALGNYRAVFHLLNAPAVISAIDVVRDNVEREAAILVPQQFRVVRAWDNQRYWLVERDPRKALWQLPGDTVLAIWEPVAVAFLTAVTQMLTRTLAIGERWISMPVADRIFGRDTENSFVQFPDGLAALANFREDGLEQWVPLRGLGGRPQQGHGDLLTKVQLAQIHRRRFDPSEGQGGAEM